MARVIEYVEACYEVEEVAIEEKLPLTATKTTCVEYGSDHATLVGDELSTRPERDGIEHL